MIIVGIDPGAHGGIAVLDSEIGITDTYKMPVIYSSGDINAGELFSILPFGNDTHVFIESVHSMPGQGVASSFKFGYSVGMIEAACAIAEGGHSFINHVQPLAWQKAGPGKTGGDKSITIEWVKKTYPEAQIIPKGCRVPHDGICDAIGIAHYGLLLLQGKIDPPKAKPIRRKKKK